MSDAAGHTCPACDKSMFSGYGSYELYRVCGWENDGVQFDDPDYRGGANGASLNEARDHYRRRQQHASEQIPALAQEPNKRQS